jgi:hypothetical protein
MPTNVSLERFRKLTAECCARSSKLLILPVPVGGPTRHELFLVRYFFRLIQNDLLPIFDVPVIAG